MGELTRKPPGKRTMPVPSSPVPLPDRQPAGGQRVPPLHRALGNTAVASQSTPAEPAPQVTDGLQRDENGVIQLPGEVIYVTGKAPPKTELDRQIAAGLSHVITRDEMQRQEIFEYESQPGALSRSDRARYYRDHPEAEAEWNEGLQERYDKIYSRAEDELDKQQRRINTAAGVVNGIAVGYGAAGAVLVAGEVLASAAVTRAAYWLGPKLFFSARITPVLAFAAGAITPPGGPEIDLPGPVDDAGRLAHLLFAKATRPPGGSNVAANKVFWDAVAKAERLLKRKLTHDDIELIHDAIAKKDYGFHDIVDLIVGEFSR